MQRRTDGVGGEHLPDLPQLRREGIHQLLVLVLQVKLRMDITQVVTLDISQVVTQDITQVVT